MFALLFDFLYCSLFVKNSAKIYKKEEIVHIKHTISPAIKNNLAQIELSEIQSTVIIICHIQQNHIFCDTVQV